MATSSVLSVPSASKPNECRRFAAATGAAAADAGASVLPTAEEAHGELEVYAAYPGRSAAAISRATRSRLARRDLLGRKARAV